MKHFTVIVVIAAMLMASLPAFAGFRSAEEYDSMGNVVKYQPSSDVERIADINYAQYDSRKLLLDLYLPKPKGKTPIPCIVVIRGGGWLEGDKNGYAPHSAYLAKKGFAAACIEYRTSQEAPFPAAVNDVKAAVRWVRANASKHGIDPNKIGAMGGSAGGHLTLMLGTTDDVPEFEGNGGNPGVSSRVQAIVAMAPAGVLEFLGHTAAEKIGSTAKFLGKRWIGNQMLWQKASPINYIDPDSAPALIIHSFVDIAVPYESSIRLMNLYEMAGVDAACHFFTIAYHTFWFYDTYFDNTMELASDFFEKKLK